MNLVCCICTEILSPSDDIYSTLCGHLFHNRCLNLWLERSKSCPQCRSKIPSRNTHKVYFNIANTSETSFSDVGLIQQTNDNLKLQIQEKESRIRDLQTKMANDEKLKQKMNEKYNTAIEKNRSAQFLIDTLKEQLVLLEFDKTRFDAVHADLKKAQTKIYNMKVIEEVLNSTAKEVEDIIKNETNTKTLAVLVATLKRELVSNENRRKELSSYLKNVQDLCKKKDDVNLILKRRIKGLIHDKETLNVEVESLKAAQSNENNRNISNIEPVNIQEDPRKRLNVVRRNSVAYLDSPPVQEKVRRIEESTSPYLNIKSSVVGLVPLLRNPLRPSSTSGAEGTGAKSKTIEIFKRPRIYDDSSIPRLSSNSNTALNGLGCSERRQN